jgi:hypothetical protein
LRDLDGENRWDMVGLRYWLWYLRFSAEFGLISMDKLKTALADMNQLEPSMDQLGLALVSLLKAQNSLD